MLNWVHGQEWLNPRGKYVNSCAPPFVQDARKVQTTSSPSPVTQRYIEMLLHNSIAQSRSYRYRSVNLTAAVHLNIAGYVGRRVNDAAGHDVELRSFVDPKHVGDGCGVTYYPHENMYWSDAGR